MKLCQDIMDENPALCLANDKVQAVAQRMHTENVDYVLVVQDYQSNKLIGMLTDRDIALRVVGKGLNPFTTQVTDIMTQHLTVCHLGEEAESTLKNMAVRELRRLPVVDDHGELMGIIVQSRTIQARISIRLDNEHKVSAYTIKDAFDGNLTGFAEKVSETIKRITLMNSLSESLNLRDDDSTLPAVSVS